jgi:protein TonB
MSHPRLALSMAAIAATVSLSGWTVVSTLPRRATAQKVVRVGSGIGAPRKIVDVPPVYPEDAKAAGVSGVVIVEARIATDGSIAYASIVKSIPMLDDAAVDAVLQWKYEPTTLNGEAVEVIITVTVNFAVR